MNGKFVFGGEGAKVPGTDFGISFALFKLWFKPTGLDWKGYTTASNQGLLGAAIIETPIVDFVTPDLEDEEPFMNLHNSSVEVNITPTLFAIDGGTATIRITKRNNDGTPNRQISFFSDECKGFSASIGDIHFTATLLQLPDNENDPTGVSFVPF